MNKKKTSKDIAAKAGKALSDPNASKIKKSLAASAIAQADGDKQTGKEMETKASKVLQSDKYSEETKELAASVLSQSNKKR
ncbi:hypothetical protein C4G51_RS18685 [Vibrio parahaemolyticus]|nr:hypothetical protein [Vibrio parahaemolyticus]